MRISQLIFVPLLPYLAVFGQTARQIPSPVELRIEAAQKQVTANPKSAGAFTDLAFALIRKARDYQDEAVYAKANEALNQALHLSPGNYDAQKLQVAVLLGMNKPADALKLETELNHKVPDDIAGWALLVDANAALGNYDQAEHAAQWVLDLRPGSALGFEKAAELRVIFGDAEGASEFMDEANRRTSQNDADQRAWLFTQKARLILAAGNTKGAADLLAEATRLFPDSQLAEGVLAQVRMAEGNYPEALALLEKRYRTVPNAANLYEWAQGLERAGNTEEASAKFKTFEAQARADSGKQRATRLSLISYYSDRKSDPAEALTLASKEAAERHDTATLEAYAWALYRNGKYPEAKVQMDKALAVGVREAEYFCHAARIAEMAKDSASAEKYKRELSGMPGSSCVTDAPLQTANQGKR